jgi:hypothetical protein
MEHTIKLTLKPDWDEIEPAREKSAKFFETHGFAEDHVNSLIMVVSELAENAVKYGAYPDGGGSIGLGIEIGNKTVIIEVTNPVKTGDLSFLKHLDETIQWIRGFQDPFEAYAIRLKEVATRPLADRESGLGLVRISYEGQSILDFFVSDDNVLSVSAVYNY